MNARDQVKAARERALAVAHLDRATLAVTGKDRVTWLNGMLTCDLVKCASGAAVYGLAVAQKGRILADAFVVLDEPAERTLLAVPGATAHALREHLDHYLVMEDAAISERPEPFEAWSVHGPRWREALEAARADGGVGGELDLTGLGGAFVLAPPDRTREVGAALARAALVGDAEGWEALRLERAVPRFGVDFDDETYPQEAGLEKTAVSFDKGCYLGQEVVCMLELRGHVKRKLVPVVIESTRAPARGAPVLDDAGAVVGEVTSAGVSPTRGKAVALAMVKRALAQPRTRVTVGDQIAEVVERPA